MTLPSDASVQCDYLDLPSTFLTYETEFCRYFMNFLKVILVFIWYVK